MTAGKRHKLVILEEVKDALPKKIRDYANVVPKVECVPQMYAFVVIEPIVVGQGRQYLELNLRRLAVLLHGSDDFDGNPAVSFTIVCFDDSAKCALPE